MPGGHGRDGRAERRRRRAVRDGIHNVAGRIQQQDAIAEVIQPGADPAIGHFKHPIRVRRICGQKGVGAGGNDDKFAGGNRDGRQVIHRPRGAVPHGPAIHGDGIGRRVVDFEPLVLGFRNFDGIVIDF